MICPSWGQWCLVKCRMPWWSCVCGPSNALLHELAIYCDSTWYNIHTYIQAELLFSRKQKTAFRPYSFFANVKEPRSDKEIIQNPNIVMVTSKWHTPPPTTKIPNSGAKKKGIQLIRRSTTLSAISWAVVGVGQQLFDPSPPKLPRASNGYSQSALRCVREELRQSPRGRNWANFGQILGRHRHWALYLAPIDRWHIDC
jgi:hypothetical protein